MSQHTSKTLIQYYNSPYPLTCLNMMKSFSVVLGINLIQVLLWKSAIASNTICLSSIPYKYRLKVNTNIINRNNLHLSKPNAQIFRCCYFLCRFNFMNSYVNFFCFSFFCFLFHITFLINTRSLTK